VTVEVASALNIPQMLMVVNKVPAMFDPEEVRERVAQTFNSPVAAVLPHSDEMMTLASAGIFVQHFPDHPITAELHQMTQLLIA
jgi:MinD-like ATPase involved in chromosome partitioning or flagellar assembly